MQPTPNTSQESYIPLSSSQIEQLYEEIVKDQTRIFKCLAPLCGKIFKFRSEIKRHIAIHSNQRPYSCSFPECTKSFKRADALAHHLQLHISTSPFPCPFKNCDATYSTKAALNYHLLKHGEKNFVCSFSGCNKAFRTYSQVQNHEKTHLNYQNDGLQEKIPEFDFALEDVLFPRIQSTIIKQQGQNIETSQILSFNTPNPEGTFNLTEIELKIFDHNEDIQLPPQDNIISFTDPNTLNEEIPQQLPLEDILKAFITENDHLKKRLEATLDFIQKQNKEGSKCRKS